MSTRWIAVADGAALRSAARDRIVEAASRALASRGIFIICLSGGNTPRDVYRMLREVSTDWPRWHVYFGDERCLPSDDPARNSRMAAEALLDHVAIPRSQVHVIPAERGAAQAALDYAQVLEGVGDFDLALLGLGEDGHTASLFPGHDRGAAPGSADVLAVTGAPKPPPDRVTLSAARLSRAREVVFLVEGEGKRGAIARWRNRDDIPARAVNPPGGVDVLVESTLVDDDNSGSP
jgi:6-phosphogluconolactonase